MARSKHVKTYSLSNKTVLQTITDAREIATEKQLIVILSILGNAEQFASNTYSDPALTQGMYNTIDNIAHPKVLTMDELNKYCV